MFLDIAFGVLASYITANLFNVAITWQLICLGAFFVLLPDVDFFWNNNQKIDHRGFMHYPLYYVLVSTLITLTGNHMFAFLFFITTVFHFIHDTFILGWGVVWCAPFSLRRYKIFPDDGKGGFLQKKFLTLLPNEQEALEKKLNDKHWIRNWYGRITVVSVIEYFAFFLATAYIMYTFLI